MQCPNCDHVNSANAKFCEECATPLKRQCGNCSEALSATAKFCPECGTAAAIAQAATPVVEEPQAEANSHNSPASYTPKHLIEKIVLSRSAIEGERKLVTVMFADLKGSTQMIAEQDPEVAQAVLDPMLNIMMDAVHDYEGTVTLVLGDGLMAIFGAPVALEDHGVRACYAALQIQERLATLANEIREKYKKELSVRIGLNSGDVVVRSIGSDLRMDYSAVGLTTHLASRMEQLAEPGTILLSPATARMVEGYVTTRSAGLKDVKGVAEPMEAFELTGAMVVRSRLEAAVARGLTRFLSRGLELNLMSEAIQRANAGAGQVVAMSGEAGIGKSRLIWEFVHSDHTEGWTVLQSACSAHDKSHPYAPIIGLLRDYFGLANLDGPSGVSTKINTKLEELDPSLLAVAPGILSLIGVESDDPEWAAFDPSARRRRLINGLRGLFLMESKRNPLILVIDDLHWIDEETLAFLDALVDGVTSAKMFLLVGYRPEFTHEWTRKTYFREIRVSPMGNDGALQLLDTILGMDRSLSPLKELLLVRTDGNPFFIEESVRTLHEMNFIGGEFGNFKLLKATEAVRIPESAKAILSARIDRLNDDHKRVLQAAAVIGIEAPFKLLSQVCDCDTDTLREAIAQLQNQEFIFEASIFPDLIFRFRHALVQEVAYDSLLGDRRIGLHRAIVEVEETKEDAASLATLNALAHHSHRGELWERAAHYSHEAGHSAMRLTALGDARAHFEHALHAIDQLPVDEENQQRRIDTAFDLRSVLVLQGELEVAKRVLTEARDRAQNAGETSRVGMANCYLCNLYWEMGEQDRAIEEGHAAEAVANDIGNAKIADTAARYLARAYQAVGDYEQAIDLFSRCLPEGDPSSPSHILMRSFLTNCLIELGRFEEAKPYAQATVAAAVELQNPLGHSAALATLGRVHLRMGDFQAAADQLEPALQVSRQADIELLFPFAAAPLGAALAHLQRFKEAEELLSSSVERAATMNRMVDASLWRYWQGRMYLFAGDHVAARRTAESGLALSITYKERGNQASLLSLLGDIYAGLGEENHIRAKTHYAQGLSLSETLKMAPIASRCYAGLARVYSDLGEKELAQEHADKAAELAQKTGVGFWLEANRNTPLKNTTK